MLRQNRNLHVHQRRDGKPVTPVCSIDIPVFCIALSRNDKFVALGFASEVWIYKIEDQQMCRYKLPSGRDAKLNGQRVCFSADSEKVIVATRNAAGYVYTYVSECTRNTIHDNLPHVSIPTVSHFLFIPSYG